MSARGAGPGRIERAVRDARRAGRPALAPFLTAGFPRRAGFDDVLRRTASVADLVEIGVPFSDPMADGATIQRSSRAALDDGVTLPWILDTLAGVRLDVPSILMSYLNPLLAYGVERLARDAAAAGVCGLIVPDLPLEESGELRPALAAAGLGLVQLVSPVTADARLRRLCEASEGFVYAVTMTGTTGGAVDDGGDALATYLARVRAASRLPVLAGFGIRTAADLARLAPHCDGAVVGSALIERLERGEDPAAFLRGLLQEVTA